MQFLLAPAKTQKFNGRRHPFYSMPRFLDEAAGIMNALRQLPREELAVLLKTSERLSRSIFRWIHDFTIPFGPENAHQALFVFQGDAYQKIHADQYRDSELRYAQQHLFILSGLYGMLRPMDLIQPYRLEMATGLHIGDGNNLYRLWREKVTSHLNQALQNDPPPVCVNLASLEYAKVIDAKKLAAPMVQITFRQNTGRGLKTIAIHAKRARGMMVEFAIRNQVADVQQLKDFRSEGYRFAPGESSADELVFLQEEDKAGQRSG